MKKTGKVKISYYLSGKCPKCDGRIGYPDYITTEIICESCGEIIAP